MSGFKGTRAKDYLLQTSPNEKHGLRASLQKYFLRGVVEKEMEMYAELRIKESKAPEMLEMLEKVKSSVLIAGDMELYRDIEQLIKSATKL